MKQKYFKFLIAYWDGWNTKWTAVSRAVPKTFFSF